MSWLSMETWSPYAVGVAIGVLSWFSFLFSDKAIGTSTAFSRLSGMIEKSLRGRDVEEKEYYRKTAPVIEWQVMLVFGIVIGAFLASALSGSFRFEMLASHWTAYFGDTSFLRFIVALIGGILMGIGSRWANGCTSGHGISGTLQMAISSWISVVCIFIAGIVTAVLIYL